MKALVQGNPLTQDDIDELMRVMLFAAIERLGGTLSLSQAEYTNALCNSTVTHVLRGKNNESGGVVFTIERRPPELGGT